MKQSGIYPLDASLSLVCYSPWKMGRRGCQWKQEAALCVPMPVVQSHRGQLASPALGTVCLHPAAGSCRLSFEIQQALLLCPEYRWGFSSPKQGREKKRLLS